MYADVPAPVRMTRASGLLGHRRDELLQLRMQPGQQRMRPLQHLRLLLDLARRPQRTGGGQFIRADAEEFELFSGCGRHDGSRRGRR